MGTARYMSDGTSSINSAGMLDRVKSDCYSLLDLGCRQRSDEKELKGKQGEKRTGLDW